MQERTILAVPEYGSMGIPCSPYPCAAQNTMFSMTIITTQNKMVMMPPAFM